MNFFHVVSRYLSLALWHILHPKFMFFPLAWFFTIPKERKNLLFHPLNPDSPDPLTDLQKFELYMAAAVGLPYCVINQKNERSLMPNADVQAKLDAQRKFCQDRGFPQFSFYPCPVCHRPWTSSYTLEEAGSTHIISCPHCHRSWCD